MFSMAIIKIMKYLCCLYNLQDRSRALGEMADSGTRAGNRQDDPAVTCSARE